MNLIEKVSGKPKMKTTLVRYESGQSRELGVKTFPILGIPRGGTTAVAGVVRELGVFIGDKLPDNLEDPAFSKPASITTSLVEARNATHNVWGWKFPSASAYLDQLMPSLRNPRIIMVTRDLTSNTVAVSERHKNFDDERALEMVLTNTLKNYTMVTRFGKPVLMVSYEKLILQTERTVREIADFLCLNPDREALLRAEKFVEPGRYRSEKR